MSDQQSHEKKKPPPRLRRKLSSTTANLLKRFLRLGRRDSGYDSEDQMPSTAAAAAIPDSPEVSSGSSEEIQQLESQEEVEAVDENNGTDTDEEEGQKTRRLSNSERHLINISASLLLEQDRTSYTLLLADLSENEEIAVMRRCQVDEEKLEEKEYSKHKLLPAITGCNTPSSSCEGCDYFEQLMEQRRQDRYESAWHWHWQKRTSNRMYEGYRNDLDYRY